MAGRRSATADLQRNLEFHARRADSWSQIPDGVKRRFFGLAAGLLAGRAANAGRPTGAGRLTGALFFAGAGAAVWAVFFTGSETVCDPSEAGGSALSAGSAGGSRGSAADSVTG